MNPEQRAWALELAIKCSCGPEQSSATIARAEAFASFLSGKSVPASKPKRKKK